MVAGLGPGLEGLRVKTWKGLRLSDDRGCRLGRVVVYLCKWQSPDGPDGAWRMQTRYKFELDVDCPLAQYQRKRMLHFDYDVLRDAVVSDAVDSDDDDDDDEDDAVRRAGGYDAGEMINRCLVCGIDMGPQNPRQLCGKWRCRNAKDAVEDGDGVEDVVEDAVGVAVEVGVAVKDAEDVEK